MKHGKEIEWTSTYKLSVTHYKNGILNGKRTIWHNSKIKASISNYVNGVKHGDEINWHKNGVVAMKCTYNNGLCQGYRNKYYSNGCLQSTHNFANGEEVVYYRNNKIKERSFWEDDEVIKCYMWYKTGELKSTHYKKYSNGYKYSFHRLWYKNGCINTMYCIKNDDYNGKYLSWSNNGKKEQESYYINGKLHGKSRTWTNGILMSVNNYVNGQKHGTQIETDSNYNRTISMFDMGKQVDRYVEWTTDKIKLLECFYKNDKLDGQYEKWNKNGVKLISCNYKNGILDGRYNSWHPNGNREIACFYKNGILEGDYLKFFSNGVMNEKSLYVKGYLHGLSQIRKKNMKGSPLIECEYRYGKAKKYNCQF